MNTFESLFVFVFLQTYFLLTSEHIGSFQAGAAAATRPTKRSCDCFFLNTANMYLCISVNPDYRAGQTGAR
jgi:hypothetical protein